MKLSDLPPDQCRDLIWSILDRYHSARERWPPHKGLRTEAHLSLNDARLIYAGSQWLQRYSGWVTEAGGKVGVWPGDFSLSFCAKWLSDLSQSMNKEDPIIILSDRDMRIINDCANHLDHYFLLLEGESGKRRRK